MSKQVNLLNIPNVISSLDSAAGATPCALPDGPRIDLFGRAVAHASLLAQPVPGGGVTDERHLWPVWFNLIRECRPDVIFGEQVEAAINHGWLDLVQTDLEGEGYACGAVGLPAGGVGAPHIRQRLWFVAESDGCVRGAEQESKQPTRGERGEPARNCGAVDGQLADANNRHQFGNRSGGGKGNKSKNQRGWSNEQVDGCLSSSQLGNNNNKGSQGHGQSGEQHDAEGRQGAQRHNPTPSFWINCDWLPCRDGRSRPVEPGTFPLAHGVANRVGLLRGYGNSLVAPQAQAFIEAYMEIS